MSKAVAPANSNMNLIPLSVIFSILLLLCCLAYPACASVTALLACVNNMQCLSSIKSHTSWLRQFPVLQATYCCDKLGLDREKVNVNGGAIALGHPLGCTGARCTATLLHEMQKRGKAARFGVVSMCIGSGMGAAAVFERGGEIDEPKNVRPAQKMSYLSRDAQ